MNEHEDLIFDMLYGVQPKPGTIEAEHYEYEREQVLGEEQ